MVRLVSSDPLGREAVPTAGSTVAAQSLEDAEAARVVVSCITPPASRPASRGFRSPDAIPGREVGVGEAPAAGVGLEHHGRRPVDGAAVRRLVWVRGIALTRGSSVGCPWRRVGHPAELALAPLTRLPSDS